jgi:hypothetical protein
MNSSHRADIVTRHERCDEHSSLGAGVVRTQCDLHISDAEDLQSAERISLG